MHFARREMMIGGGAALLLAGCMDTPGALTVSAQGSAGMNPGPDGADRPLTLTVVQLRSTAAFRWRGFLRAAGSRYRAGRRSGQDRSDRAGAGRVRL